MVEEYKLTLFVKPDNFETAVRHVHKALEQLGRDQYELVTVDVTQYPGLAKETYVLRTPTLVYHSPLRGDVLIHDVSDHSAISEALEIDRI